MQNIDTKLIKYYKKFSEAYQEDIKKPENERVFNFKYLDEKYNFVSKQYIQGMMNYEEYGIRIFPPFFASYYSILPEDIRKILNQ